MTSEFQKFALISGFFWGIDLILTMGLVQLGFSPFIGSLFGAATAVIGVYFVSHRMLFPGYGTNRVTSLGFYVLWQVFAISAASALVGITTRFLVAAVASPDVPMKPLFGPIDTTTIASGLAKVLVTPLTLVANFLFLRGLTRLGMSRPKNDA